MSSPPPPTFDFIVKDAKGEHEWQGLAPLAAFVTYGFCADVEDMVGRLCAVMEVLTHDVQHLTCSM